jgi:hypothetical protein
LSRAFEQTLTVDALRDKIDDAESALRRADRLPLVCGRCRSHSQIRDRIDRAPAGRRHGVYQRRSGPLRQATSTVPIVFAVGADPVGAGYFESPRS